MRRGRSYTRKVLRSQLGRRGSLGWRPQVQWSRGISQGEQSREGSREYYDDGANAARAAARTQAYLDKTHPLSQRRKVRQVREEGLWHRSHRHSNSSRSWTPLPAEVPRLCEQALYCRQKPHQPAPKQHDCDQSDPQWSRQTTVSVCNENWSLSPLHERQAPQPPFGQTEWLLLQGTLQKIQYGRLFHESWWPSFKSVVAG